MGLTEAQREVAGMVHSGTPFDAIEDRIQIIPGFVDMSDPDVVVRVVATGERLAAERVAQLLRWLEH